MSAAKKATSLLIVVCVAGAGVWSVVRSKAPTVPEGFPVSESPPISMLKEIYLPEPGPCSSNVVVDPSFEDTSVGAWTGDIENVKLHDPFIVPDARPFSGDYFLWLGNYNSPTKASVTQSVVIPATGNATLNFFLFTEQASLAHGAADRLEISLDGVAGGTIFANDTTYHSGYTWLMLDVSKWADGYAHELRFETNQTGSTNAADITNFLIDEVDISTGENCEDNWGIDVAPGFLRFGRVAMNGGAKQLTISVINTGASPLVGSISVEPPSFGTTLPYSIVENPPDYDIPPAGAATFTVAFAPVEEVATPGRLRFSGGGYFMLPLYGFTEPADPFTNKATGVIIEEIQAWNTMTVRDGEGDTPPWIELRNFNDFPVNVGGWKLTHTANGVTDPAWVLPDIDIRARGYLLVFVSGKTDPRLDSGLHASFALNKDTGGTLGLLRSDNSMTEQSPTYPAPIRPDRAYAYQALTGPKNNLDPWPISPSDGTWHVHWKGSPLGRNMFDPRPPTNYTF